MSGNKDTEMNMIKNSVAHLYFSHRLSFDTLNLSLSLHYRLRIKGGVSLKSNAQFYNGKSNNKL